MILTSMVPDPSSSAVVIYILPPEPPPPSDDTDCPLALTVPSTFRSLFAFSIRIPPPHPPVYINLSYKSKKVCLYVITRADHKTACSTFPPLCPLQLILSRKRGITVLK